ncbi:hypothetical protein P171DRAFT_165065 [Karstenula rhodostoma CBS 690.94]|uniref:Uncharacterized protein n=1 Tax=Karstenula rhodostoma CBS 690.94 TaxID=1392251 RepID=A0A9P4U6C5_9PLEO|nr:hypothetical protein P171DRAFT_165065 [Karstenula rhodostoma CBS 690.94]
MAGNNGSMRKPRPWYWCHWICRVMVRTMLPTGHIIISFCSWVVGYLLLAVVTAGIIHAFPLKMAVHACSWKLKGHPSLEALTQKIKHCSEYRVRPLPMGCSECSRISGPLSRYIDRHGCEQSLTFACFRVAVVIR